MDGNVRKSGARQLTCRFSKPFRKRKSIGGGPPTLSSNSGSQVTNVDSMPSITRANRVCVSQLKFPFSSGHGFEDDRKVAQPFLAVRSQCSLVIPSVARGLLFSLGSSGHGFTACGKRRLTCRSRLQPRHKCLTINWALAPEGLPFDSFRNLFSCAASAIDKPRLQPRRATLRSRRVQAKKQTKVFFDNSLYLARRRAQIPTDLLI